MASASTLNRDPFFVRPSLLVCTLAKKTKSQTKFLMSITLKKSQSGNPELKLCALILSNLHLLELYDIIILQILLQRSES